MAILTKRFLTFDFTAYETGSFMYNFKGAFDTLEEAVERVKNDEGGEVVDLSTYRTVWMGGEYIHVCPQCNGTGSHIAPPPYRGVHDMCPRCHGNKEISSDKPIL